MIIGVNGRINSGKSLVSSLFKKLAEKYNKKVEIKSFAYPIYKAVSDITGLSIHEIKSRKKEHSTIHIGSTETNFRNILQSIGNGLREYGDYDIWLDTLFGSDNQKAIENLTWNNDWWVIDDLRYHNEAERIKSLGGYLFQVVRDKAENNSHQAENSLSEWTEWDMIIDNNYPTKESAMEGVYPLLDGFVKEKLYG